MRIGIVGLSFSGKSSLFNNMIKSKTDSNRVNSIGVAKVPDIRINKLKNLFQPKKTTYSELEFIDFKESMSTLKDYFIPKYLVQEMQKIDQLMIVIRAFNNDAVPHELKTVDYVRDLKTIMFELAFADIELIEKRIERLTNDKKGLKSVAQKRIEDMINSLKSIQQELEKGVLIKDIKLSTIQKEAIKDTFFISKLPISIVINSSDDNSDLLNDTLNNIEKITLENVTIINSMLEEELNQLDEKEQEEYRKDYKLGESAINKITDIAYKSSQLISFMTVGQDEVRSWSIQNGINAVNSASKIHSDIKKGFIRAEVINYNDFIGIGSLVESKKLGKLKQESKDYIVQDGDIINFLFSV